MDPDPSLEISTYFDQHLLAGILILIILLFFSGLITAAESSLLSATDKDIKKLAKDHPEKGAVISKILETPKKLSTTLLIADIFINSSFSLLFFAVTINMFSFTYNSVAFLCVLALINFFILLFGELIPRRLTSGSNTAYFRFIAYPLAVLDKIFTPLSVFMSSASVFLSGTPPKQKSDSLVGQLPDSVSSPTEEVTTTEEQKILEGIISFGNTDTRQVMTPRIDIFALNIEDSFAEIYPKIIESGYSRIPVYRDNIDQIEGVLFVKDLLPQISKNEFDWKILIREPFFVPETKKLENLLTDFQGRKSHLAVVVDEYGSTCGVISLEDIIEEIVGDISDESDGDEINYTQTDDNTFIFDGKIGLKDFYRIVPVDDALFEDSRGEAETLAGFILGILEAFPRKGQKIPFGDLIFTIEQLDRKRIKQIKVTIE